MIKQRLQGTGVALITPFDEKLQVDFEGLSKLLQLTVKEGVDYVVIHGTTGEAATTTLEEKKEVLAFVKAYNSKDMPIVYGLGGNNTKGVLKKIAATDFQGIDAVLTVSPYYNRPSQEGIYLHYKAIADACPVPIILYNVPARTGSNLEASTTLRLSEHPNIIGIKEASGNLIQCLAIAKGKPADFLLISGDDILTVPMIAIGAAGVISTLANGFPRQVCQMVQAALQHDYVKARAYQFRLLKLHELVSKGGNPAATKQILEALSVCKHYVRLPLAPVAAALKAQIYTTIQELL